MNILASLRNQRLRQANLNGSEIVLPAAKSNAPLRPVRIRCRKLPDNRARSKHRRLVSTHERRRNLDRMKRRPDRGEVSIRRKSRTSSVGRPLVLDERDRRNQIQILLRIRRRRRVRAILRICPVIILRPHAVDYKARMRSAFRTALMSRAIFRRPRQRQQIEVKGSGLRVRRRTSAPRFPAQSRGGNSWPAEEELAAGRGLRRRGRRRSNEGCRRCARASGKQHRAQQQV